MGFFYGNCFTVKKCFWYDSVVGIAHNMNIVDCINVIKQITHELHYHNNGIGD
jgi:hypothetical protein